METENGAVKNVGFEMITPAKEIAAAKNLKTVAVIIGNGIDEAAKQAGNYGADAVITVDAPAYKAYASDEYAAVLTALAEKYKPEAILLALHKTVKTLRLE